MKREEHVETPKHESDVAFFALNSNVQWPGTRGLVLVDLFRGGPVANNVLVPLDQSQPLHLTLTVDGVLPVPISLPWISISATCIAMNAQLLQICPFFFWLPNSLIKRNTNRKRDIRIIFFDQEKYSDLEVLRINKN